MSRKSHLHLGKTAFESPLSSPGRSGGGSEAAVAGTRSDPNETVKDKDAFMRSPGKSATRRICI